MFERFTDGARRVLVLAQEESRVLGHDRIGTGHLLLGLLLEGGVPSRALSAIGVSVDAARRALVEQVFHSGEPASGPLPFTPRAKKLLELSLREALQLGCSHIGPEHLLLGLVREEGGAANTVLEALGSDRADVRHVVYRLLAGLDSLPAIPADEVRPIDWGTDTCELLTPADVEEVLREHRSVGTVERRELPGGGVRYIGCSYTPPSEPTVRLAVIAAEITAEVFDRYCGGFDHEEVVEVEGVGDRATFDALVGTLRVLSGSTLFVLTMSGASRGSLELATALAGRVLARLNA